MCGHGGLFLWWFRLKDRCPARGLELGRGKAGHELRAIILNLSVALLIWFVAYLVILASTWPDPPSTLLDWGSAVFMIALPCLLYPFSQLLATVIDLLNRPLSRDGASSSLAMRHSLLHAWRAERPTG